MKRFLPGLILGLAAGVALMWWGARPGVRSTNELMAPAAATGATADDAGIDVELSAEAVAAAGLETAAPQAITVRDRVEGFARVLDPAPLLALDHERAAAAAALVASRRELERLRALHEHDRNASARAVELAEAEVARDENTLAAVQDRLRLGWGPAVASPELLSQLRAGAVDLARVDVVSGEVFAAEPTDLVLSGRRERTAAVLGAAPQTDATLQGRAWLVTVGDTTGLGVGSTLMAQVPRSADESPAWLVPTAAVVRHDGRSWVFVAEGTTRFRRRAVTLGTRRSDGEVVLDGLAAGERVVSVGAQQLLSAGLSGTEGEE